MIQARTLIVLALCAGCAQIAPPPTSTKALDADSLIQAAFTVQAEGRAFARVITRSAACPVLEVQGAASALPMAVRAVPGVVPARAAGQGLDRKPALFDVLTCEAELPAALAASAARAQVAGRELPLPRAEIKTIVIVGDTGCRMQQSGNFFQDCTDANSWPFERIAERAAALHPDLVIHVGDYHYRESACPGEMQGCAGSPWGYGYDTWYADFFRPARALLAAAPWVFVRGNHESCARAGQGWFRFMAPEPWTEERSCNDPRRDSNADFSEPYAVPLPSAGAASAQLIVFDSSRTSGRPYDAASPAYKAYFAQLQTVDGLAGRVPHSFFLSHHPVLAFAPEQVGKTIVVRPGNAGQQSVMSAVHPTRLFAPGIDIAMHGHIHLFEAVSFSSGQPIALVLGNSGSYRDHPLPSALPPGLEPAPGAVVQDFATSREFGFASLERSGADWLLTEWNVEGKALLRCSLVGATSHCAAASAMQ